MESQSQYNLSEGLGLGFYERLRASRFSGSCFEAFLVSPTRTVLLSPMYPAEARQILQIGVWLDRGLSGTV
jgi:hypothetical protein